MANRSDYRTALRTKLVGLEQAGYGDFDYVDDELNSYLELTVARLFPHVYKKVSLAGQTVTGYGTNSLGSVDLGSVDESRVFMVEDPDEYAVLRNWERRPNKLVNIDADYATVNVYYIAPYSMPSDDSTAVEWESIYKPLVVQGALVEAIEARHDAGVRPDPPQEGGRAKSLLLDASRSAFERMKSDMAMALPSVVM